MAGYVSARSHVGGYAPRKRLKFLEQSERRSGRDADFLQRSGSNDDMRERGPPWKPSESTCAAKTPAERVAAYHVWLIGATGRLMADGLACQNEVSKLD